MTKSSRDDDAPENADIGFQRTFQARSGVIQRLTPLVRRIVADNPGPFTFTGTCTYILGRGSVAVIDPGPADASHLQALLDGTRGETIAWILVTHTHRDHSPGAKALAAATGAEILGCAPYRPWPQSAGSETNPLDAAHDIDYRPARILQDGEIFLRGDDFTLTALATPGHAANHLCFALAEEQALFSGDHVMAWSTSVVAPPDGSMGAYISSLDRLRGRPETIYWPGHGGPVTEPQKFVRGLISHRRQRDAAILARIRAGDDRTAEIVARLYRGLDPRLTGAAALSVFAHIEDQIARGLVVAEGPAHPAGRFRPR